MGTAIVGAILICVICAVVKSMVKEKRAGKSLQCGGCCKHYKGHCH